MKICNVVKTTTSRYEFNRAYKQHLERLSKIHCGYCDYHRGENNTNNYYYIKDNDDAKYPNWKLSTSNKKQWMVKEKKTLKNTNDANRYSKRNFFNFNGKRVTVKSPFVF